MSAPFETPIAAPSVASEPPPVPKLSIAFLLAEMFVLSVMLALMRPMFADRFDTAPVLEGEEKQATLFLVVRAANVIGSLLTASSVAAVFVLLGHRTRYPTFRYQPGHWIHFFNGIECLGTAFVYAVIMISSFSFNTTIPLIYGNVYATLILLALPSNLFLFITAIIAFRRSQGESVWRWLFSGIAVYSILYWFDMLIFDDFDVVASMTILLIMTLAIASDLRSRKTRDWHHWLGAALFAIRYAIGVVGQAAYHFLT